MRAARVALALCVAGLWGCFPGNNHCADDGAGMTPDAAAGPSVYRPTIQMDLEALNCTSCHQTAMVALDMLVMPEPEDDAAWMANYENVKEQVMGYEGDPAGSPLLRKAQGFDDHLKSEIPEATLMRWTEWIELGAPYEEADLPSVR